MDLNYKGIKIHYTFEGSGTTVVLLHGFLENLTIWNEIKSELIKTHRVICIDLLGHGKTPCLRYVHSMEDQAKMVAFVLKNHRIRKPILIGHSMGGYVALAYAEKHPEKIKGICLMNSTSLEDDQERKELRAKANEMVKTNFTSMVRISFSNLFAETSKKRFKKEIDHELSKALKTPVQGYIACMEGMRLRPSRTHVLHQLACKKLFVIGEKDPVINYKSALLEAKETQSEMVVFPDGHMSHIENKKELRETLVTFCKKV